MEFEEEETMVRRKKKRGRKIEKEKEAIEEEGKRVEFFFGFVSWLKKGSAVVRRGLVEISYYGLGMDKCLEKCE